VESGIRRDRERFKNKIRKPENREHANVQEVRGGLAPRGNLTNPAQDFVGEKRGGSPEIGTDTLDNRIDL
jgi:hypothetical protein